MTDWSDIEDPKARKAARPLTNVQVMQFIVRYWLSQPRRFASICGLMLFATACDLVIPWAAGGLIDAVSHPARAAPAAWSAWGLLSGLYVLFYFTRSTVYRLSNRFYARNMEAMVNAAFQRVQSFSSDWHANTFAGATVRRVSRSMWGYDQVSDAVLLMLMPTLIVLTGLVVSMGLHWVWAGVFCGVVVALFIAYNIWTAGAYIRPANLKSNALDSAIGAALADAIGGNAAVKSFGAEAREEARFATVTAAWRTAIIRTWDRFNVVGFGHNLMMVTLQAGLTGMLVKAWSEGRASPGDVAFAITSFMLMSGYMRNFGDTTRMIQRGLDDTLDAAAYMRQPPEVADKAGAAELTALAGEVRFDEVSFRYKGQPQRLYDRFSLTIRPGERVALVGATGAGKSTFVKLIQRLYDVEEGRILIDGTDIAQVTQASLRRAVALVPQDPALFHRSLAENIAYARPDATADEIELAARRARAHDFIAKLPQGYDTLVGERGIKLSGGERQRVAIARAFLADAPILVLDEATSSLDVETEREVQAATEALMMGRTTVVIAHRLSTIRSADRILVFQAGRVVEEGRHGELLRQGGVYARLAEFSAA